MFSPESHAGNLFGAPQQMPQGPKPFQPKNPFHGIRRSARKGMGFPKLGLAEQGSPDIAGIPEPGQQAGTLFGSFGNQNKGMKPRF